MWQKDQLKMLVFLFGSPDAATRSAALVALG
jgi:hypothetical protein